MSTNYGNEPNLHKLLLKYESANNVQGNRFKKCVLTGGG